MLTLCVRANFSRAFWICVGSVGLTTGILVGNGHYEHLSEEKEEMPYRWPPGEDKSNCQARGDRGLAPPAGEEHAHANAISKNGLKRVITHGHIDQATLYRRIQQKVDMKHKRGELKMFKLEDVLQ